MSYSRINEKTNHIELKLGSKPGKTMCELISKHSLKWAKSRDHWHGSANEILDRSIAFYGKFSDREVSKTELQQYVDLYEWLKSNLPEVGFIQDKYQTALSHFENQKKLTFNFTTSVPDLGSKKKLKTFPLDKIEKKQEETPTKPTSIILKNSGNLGLKQKLEREGFVFTSDKEAIKKYNKPISGIEVFSEVEDSNGLSGVSGKNVYRVINEMLLDVMTSKNDLVWRKPWKSINNYGLAATNFVSKNPYRGANSFLLNFIIPFLRGKEWDNPYFLTFKQVDALRGKVKKGSEGYFVTYFNLIHKLGDKKISEQEYWSKFVQCAEGEHDFCKELKAIPVLKYYRVFNGDDIEGINWKLKKKADKPSVEKIDTAEEIWANYPPQKPQLVFKDPDSAFYSSQRDIINMPLIDTFEIEQEFYGTLFHEMVHSTGSNKRLGRKLSSKFGSKDYSYEELIAELGASYLCGESGILFHTLNNSASYLKGWKKRLKKYINDDEKFFFSAASKAQEAADFILQVDKNGIPNYRSLTRRSEKQLAGIERLHNADFTTVEVIDCIEEKKEEDNQLLKGIEDENSIISSEESERPIVHKTKNKIEGLYTGIEISSMKFDTLPFRGEWSNLMQTPPKNFKIMVYGPAKHGKTSFNFQWANYLSQYGDVLYNLAEQGITKNTQELQQKLKIDDNPRIFYSKDKTLNRLAYYIDTLDPQFVIVDLVNYYNEIKDSREWKSFQDQYDNKSFIPVLESTKSGGFRGDNNWTHVVEGWIYVEEYIARSRTRYGSGEFIVWPEKVNA